jgi:hypothetical protein
MIQTLFIENDTWSIGKADSVTLAFLIVVATAIVVTTVFIYRAHRERKRFREQWVDEPMTKDEYLSAKVKPEQDYVLVEFGGRTIQLSPAEAVIWNTWDRERKRKFVRDLEEKLQGKKTKPRL